MRRYAHGTLLVIIAVAYSETVISQEQTECETAKIFPSTVCFVYAAESVQFLTFRVSGSFECHQPNFQFYWLCQSGCHG